MLLLDMAALMSCCALVEYTALVTAVPNTAALQKEEKESTLGTCGRMP